MNRIIEAQKEAQEILDYAVNKYNLKPIVLKVKDIQSGRAIEASRFVSIPLWAYEKGIHYFYYYVLHEISHFIEWHRGIYLAGHSDIFKSIERELLKDFGLKPDYKKAYVWALTLIANGDRIYEEP